MTTSQIGKHTDILVSLIIGTVLLYVGWLILPTPALVWMVTFLLVYEGWTLINKYAEDTISEAVARLTARQPLVAWLFGNANMYVVGFVILPEITISVQSDNTSHVFGQLILLCVIEVLQGHFFFTMERKVRQAEQTRVETAAETGVVPVEGKK